MAHIVTFLSSSGDAIHTVECIGTPIYTIKCSCGGYKNIQSCKHITALLEGDPHIVDPTPAEGYAEACEALIDSPARNAYQDHVGHLANIETEKKRLVEDARSAKKEFYRKLAMGIASAILLMLFASIEISAQKVESSWDKMINVQKVEREALHNRQDSEIRLISLIQDTHLKQSSGEQSSGDERERSAKDYIVEREKLLARHAAERSEMLKIHTQERAGYRQRPDSTESVGRKEPSN